MVKLLTSLGRVHTGIVDKRCGYGIIVICQRYDIVKRLHGELRINK